MRISPPAIIVITGTTLILGAFVFFGKKKTAGPEDSPPSPVPFGEVGGGLVGFKYRGYFIGLAPTGTIPVEGFNSGWAWASYATDQFGPDALARGGGYETQEAALGGAMAWVDALRKG
jgi:hypothetical protein